MLALLAAALGGVALLLASAKAHGRQVRLERELAGHREVTFGGRNPPFVEALWRRDRVAFWTLVPLAALLLAAWLVLGDQGRLPLPPLLRDDPTFGASLLAVLPWPFVAGFVALGLASHARLLRRMRRATPAPDPAWRRAALRGSLVWWGVTLLLALLVAASFALG